MNNIKTAYCKVRKYLAEHNITGVCFNFKSYDNPEDIPHITYKGERRNIMYAELRGKESIALVLYPDWDITAINIDTIDPEELDVLLRDIYYETDESWEDSDFDTKFYNIAL